MDLSHKWLSEFVDNVPGGKEFDEAMTLSGSKVELTTFLGEEIKNVVVGKVLSLVRHMQCCWIVTWRKWFRARESQIRWREELPLPFDRCPPG